ncbi:RagB/SusD family nutrient uptake outer membrane protein [Draconibacterium sp.]|uniref:RagB/SusD family nutrient uptake outer membrane protein n=1 Tax=Draconibacterium sp. TaxID=1965318 RepID=UPI0035685934
MKNIKYSYYLSLVCLLAIMLTGCEDVFEDALNREANSRETLDGVLDDANKVRGLLSASYAGMEADRNPHRFWCTDESLTDNAFDAQGQSSGDWRSGKLSPDYSPVWFNRSTGQSSATGWWDGGWWGAYWGAIRHCNTLMENAKNITVSKSEMSQEEINLMVAEAKALRAYYHFMLGCIYGPVPFMGKNIDVNFSEWQDMERPSYQALTDSIITQLDEVISSGALPMKRNFESNDDKERISLGFVYGLKTRVLLYNASPLNNPGNRADKYEAAANACEQFLNLNAYELDSWDWDNRADSRKLYISQVSERLEEKELIWGYGGAGHNVHGMNLTATEFGKQAVKMGNKAGECPTQEIVDCYELENGALLIDRYDEVHENPVFTNEALAAGYDDYNDPYGQYGISPKRDKRFYRDIIHNGGFYGLGFNIPSIAGGAPTDSIYVMTWISADGNKRANGTGSNGNSVSGDKKRTYTGYYGGKDKGAAYYGGTGSGVPCRNARMRYAEIYLNYAEALCGAGRLNEAAEALNKTRERAEQPRIQDVPNAQIGDKEWLMKRIQNERRVELMMEWMHRFMDVRRWDVISNQDNNTISGMEVLKHDDGTFTHVRYKMPWLWVCHNEKHKILPIPNSDKKFLRSIQQPVAWGGTPFKFE